MNKLYESQVFFVSNNWEGKGYRLYHGNNPDDTIVSQVDGEINSQVWKTVRDCKAHCERRFGKKAIRVSW